MEDVSLTDKPWQLSGETGSNVRPQNSLMEEDLDFDRGTRPGNKNNNNKKKKNKFISENMTMIIT